METHNITFAINRADMKFLTRRASPFQRMMRAMVGYKKTGSYRMPSGKIIMR